jgi:hypothetical protein
MDQEKVDVTLPLNSLGLDSMMAMELKNRMEMSLHVPVSVLDLLKGVSIAELAQSQLSRLAEESAAMHRMLDEVNDLPEQGTLTLPGESTPAASAQV